MIGCDIRSLSQTSQEILTNPDLIAINQDIECRAPYEVHCESNSPEVHILCKFLSGGLSEQQQRKTGGSHRDVSSKRNLCPFRQVGFLKVVGHSILEYRDMRIPGKK